MSSNFNNKSNSNSNNTYISDLNSLSPDNFLNEVSPEDLRELSLWENAKFNNFDSNPIDIKSLDANFVDREVPVALSPSNVLVRHDFISLANQYHHPIYAYPAATQLQSIIINPPATAATYSPIFSTPSITPVAIPRNLIDITKADNSDNNGSSNNKNSNNNDNDNDNNKNNGSKNISKKSSQESSNISSTKVISNDPQNQSIDQSIKTDDDAEQTSPEEAARLAAEEDKRRRNTAASARFRVKKKLREQALERTAKDMTAKVEVLEARVKELEMENKWLRNLVVEKDARLLDIGPVGKKSGDCGGDDGDNNNNTILTEQDYKKPKIEKPHKKEITDQANKKIKLKN